MDFGKLEIRLRALVLLFPHHPFGQAQRVPDVDKRAVFLVGDEPDPLRLGQGQFCGGLRRLCGFLRLLPSTQVARLSLRSTKLRSTSTDVRMRSASASLTPLRAASSFLASTMGSTTSTAMSPSEIGIWSSCTR